MTVETVSSSFSPPTHKIGLCLQGEKTMLKTDSLIIFVCGGNNESSIPTGRSEFLKYAKKHLTNFNFFEAEKVFDVLANKRNEDRKYAVDLLSLEDQFSTYSDCIIIIVESPGAIAELGAFAIKDEIAKIILAINDENFQNTNSFISKGPIQKINLKSIFRPALHVNFDRILACVEQVKSRLEKIKRKKRRRIHVSSIEDFLDCPPKHRMFLICDLITLFTPISGKELLSLLANIYETSNIDIEIEIGMLQALGFIECHKDFFIGKTKKKETRFFFDFENINLFQLRAQIIKYYRVHDHNRLKHLAEFVRLEGKEFVR